MSDVERGAMSKNTMKTYVLLAAIAGLLIALGSLFGGRVGAFIGLLLGLAIVGFSYWNSDKLAIRAARAVPVTEAEMPEYDRIELRRARSIQGLGAAEPKVIWLKRESGPLSAHIWAPEIH